MRYYSSTAVDTALTIQINSSDTTVSVGSVAGYPTQFPFTIVIDPDTANEELVEVTNAAGLTFTVTRGFDSTTPVAHAVGAAVKHVLSASDLREPQEHIAATENVHGIADTAFLVTTNGAQTLTNKNLTSGTNTFPSSLVTETGTQTLTNKTLDSAAANYAVMKSPEEVVTATATAATGTINFDVLTQSVLYYTSNASANFTLNFRGNSGSTLNSILATGTSVTVVFLSTNGGTAYYPSAFQIDGTSVTPKWQNGVAPSAGNANNIDAYTFTIVKTASTPTYTVFATQARFA